MAHISKSHLNPAVTFSLVVIGDLNIPLASIYIVSQVIGALLGYGVLMVSQSTLQPINTTVWSSLKLWSARLGHYVVQYVDSTTLNTAAASRFICVS